MATTKDLEFMKMSIELSKKCISEDGRISPKVGVVIARGDELIGTAYRGELGHGDHAEFTALELKLKNEILTGCQIYTTLEPCTKRNDPKIPCAQRILDRKFAKVFIGMLDPNPIISGKGQLTFMYANVETEMYPHELMSQISELNRDFIRLQTHSRSGNRTLSLDDKKELVNLSLDEWYTRINKIYWNHNYYKSAEAIFSHLVEVIGGMSLLASDKKKLGVVPLDYFPKAIAWWFALCGKLGVKSVSQMLWDKFPNICPYCLLSPHSTEECLIQKKNYSGPNWSELSRIGHNSSQPRTIGDWQKMFGKIYPIQTVEQYGACFARLTEELGELSESIRVFSTAPGHFLSEAADVFAWLMHTYNLLEIKEEINTTAKGKEINIAFAKTYPGYCKDCEEDICACPPILAKTIGRITSEVPKERSNSGVNGRFLTAEEKGYLFGNFN